ncbi:MAG TPA: hypothetical protein VI056_03345 [Candidatus Limnocylindria bacterium]
MRRLLLGAVLLILGCEGAATLPAPSQKTPAAVPTATIDVSDMMGAFPAATFFVVASDGVRAIALLNHYTRYTIPTSGEAQVTTSIDGKLFVVDDAPDGTRLRSFDMGSGGERGSRIERGRRLLATGIGHGAIASDPASGSLVVLFDSGGRRVAEAFDHVTLEPLGRRLDADCGDRLLVGGGRTAVACYERGVLRIAEGTSGGTTFTWDPALGPLVAAAMLPGGSALVGRGDGTLARLAAETRDGERFAAFREGGLVRDGLAVADKGTFVAALSTDDAKIGVSTVGGRAGVVHISLPRGEQPVGGIVALWPFAYWVSGRDARHVDLAQGFAETMSSMVATARVLPGAAGDR